MRVKYKTGLSALFAFAVLTIAHAASAADIDVSGTWIMTVATSAGSGTPTFVLAQKGNAITGSNQDKRCPCCQKKKEWFFRKFGKEISPGHLYI